MGFDKAMLNLEGTPLAMRTFNNLQAAGCAPIHVVGRQPALTTLELPLISNEDDRYHPLYGLAAALQSCEQDLMLITPCDILNLSIPHIQTILAYGRPCIAVSDKRTHPLLGLFSVELSTQARQIADENGSVHEFTRNMAQVELPLPFLLNANFPSDLPG
jgi:molybdopterin-guanine dinucleotide biosynthesis protein A